MNKVHLNVDLAEWSLDAVDDIKEQIGKIILKASSEALQLAFDDEETRAVLPVVYKGEYQPDDGFYNKCPDDASTIYILVALAEQDEEPAWKFSLKDLVDEQLDILKEEIKDGDGKSRMTGLMEFSESLRKIADKIDDFQTLMPDSSSTML